MANNRDYSVYNNNDNNNKRNNNQLQTERQIQNNILYRSLKTRCTYKIII